MDRITNKEDYLLNFSRRYGAASGSIESTEQYSNNSSFLRFAFQLYLRLMHLGRMLDDGKPQAGAAGLAGVALVYPVEALKHMGLMLLGDADAGVLHRAADAPLLL